MVIRHICGGKAYVTSAHPIRGGWNLYCCGRCGAVFYHWLTKKIVGI